MTLFLNLYGCKSQDHLWIGNKTISKCSSNQTWEKSLNILSRLVVCPYEMLLLRWCMHTSKVVVKHSIELETVYNFFVYNITTSFNLTLIQLSFVFKILYNISPKLKIHLLIFRINWLSTFNYNFIHFQRL